jgi:hypothetical protein
MLEKDNYGVYEQCLQCGYIHDLQIVGKFDKQQAEAQDEEEVVESANEIGSNPVPQTMHQARESSPIQSPPARGITEATAESDVIVCEAEGGTEANTGLPINEAIRYGQLIIQKAEEKGESIISDARERAKIILDEAEQRVSETIIEAKSGCQTEVLPNVSKNTGMYSEALYAGEVELALPPPIVLANVLKLNRHLRATKCIRTIGVEASRSAGITIRIHLLKPIQLVKVLEALPEVSAVSIVWVTTRKAQTSRETRDKLLTGRLMLTMNA